MAFAGLYVRAPTTPSHKSWMNCHYAASSLFFAFPDCSIIMQALGVLRLKL